MKFGITGTAHTFTVHVRCVNIDAGKAVEFFVRNFSYIHMKDGCECSMQ